MTGLTAKLLHHRRESPEPTGEDYSASETETSQATVTATSNPPQTFTISFSSEEKGLQIWTPTNTTTSTAPTYSLRTSNNLVELWHGTDITTRPTGTAHLAKNGRTAELLLHNISQSFSMHTSHLSGASTCSHPLLGDLKWKTSKTTGLASELQRVSDGSVVAKFVAIKWSRKGPKELQVLAEGLDEEILEFVVLFGRVARVASQRNMERGAVAVAIS